MYKKKEELKRELSLIQQEYEKEREMVIHIHILYIYTSTCTYVKDRKQGLGGWVGGPMYRVYWFHLWLTMEILHDMYMWNILLCDSVTDITCSFDSDFFFLLKFYEVCCIDFQNKNKKMPKTLCSCFDLIECKKEIESERSDYYSGCTSIVA